MSLTVNCWGEGRGARGVLFIIRLENSFPNLTINQSGLLKEDSCLQRTTTRPTSLTPRPENLP